MKYRLAAWAGAGFLVAGGWALYFAWRSKDSPIEPFIYALGCFTQPIALFGRSYPLSVYVVLLANAATYALAGVTIETLRRQFKHAS